ncbi:hypothetical protein N7510_005400 [Penicillium lagena]|uniref:uncharacterized protein n=1 Tax=Penicillium lagena TaxID=94218 RepID=UPI002542046B|nr:uncharacterized protein N7510_005400 [Penicillium lagena]KAJ5612206.1 hypothetical protein N7510_005400 [Penicillium lagena]
MMITFLLLSGDITYCPAHPSINSTVPLLPAAPGEDRRSDLRDPSDGFASAVQNRISLHPIPLRFGKWAWPNCMYCTSIAQDQILLSRPPPPPSYILLLQCTMHDACRPLSWEGPQPRYEARYAAPR